MQVKNFSIACLLGSSDARLFIISVTRRRCTPVVTAPPRLATILSQDHHKHAKAWSFAAMPALIEIKGRKVGAIACSRAPVAQKHHRIENVPSVDFCSGPIRINFLP
jgi:hypothetical protein